MSSDYKVKSADAGWMVTAFFITYAVYATLIGSIFEGERRRFFIAMGLIFLACQTYSLRFHPGSLC
jgi:sugar phosphate permease